MDNLLEIQNLTVEYKREKDESSLIAVNNVSLKIKKGEIYALAG